MKYGAERWKEVVAHKVEDAGAGYADLLARVRAESARPRTEVEREIEERHRTLQRSADDVLHAWD